jgi:tRNA nucleotidyltransferase/poly(A) polymerase
MVGDPIERFDEDSLRILRAFRFASRYEHPLHKDTESAIEKRKQLENIDPETGEMKRISQERVWEEMKKAWKQARDYNYYLSFFTKFHMWDEVFPGANINTNLVKSKDLVVVIANLFKNESTLGLTDRLAQEYKIELELATKVTFLISLLNFKVEDVFDIYKKRQQCAISDVTILEWLKVETIDTDTLIKFVEYKPSVSAQELMSQGFKGKELGDEIKRLEVEKFKQML